MLPKCTRLKNNLESLSKGKESTEASISHQPALMAVCRRGGRLTVAVAGTRVGLRVWIGADLLIEEPIEIDIRPQGSLTQHIRVLL